MKTFNCKNKEIKESKNIDIGIKFIKLICIKFSALIACNECNKVVANVVRL